ncbi:hypothetical protein BHE74_00037320 [Ensete ventricosum]|nr:hypothetical protein BHE74_00037320 [Ensete ventricosum]
MEHQNRNTFTNSASKRFGRKRSAAVQRTVTEMPTLAVLMVEQQPAHSSMVWVCPLTASGVEDQPKLLLARPSLVWFVFPSPHHGEEDGSFSAVGGRSRLITCRTMKGNGAEDSSPKPPPLEWKFSQVFGERAEGEEVQEEDEILKKIHMSCGD